MRPVTGVGRQQLQLQLQVQADCMCRLTGRGDVAASVVCSCVQTAVQFEHCSSVCSPWLAASCLPPCFLFCRKLARWVVLFKLCLSKCVRRAYLSSSDVSEILAGQRQALAGIDVLRKICNHPDLLQRTQAQGSATYGEPSRCALSGPVTFLWGPGGDVPHSPVGLSHRAHNTAAPASSTGIDLEGFCSE